MYIDNLSSFATTAASLAGESESIQVGNVVDLSSTLGTKGFKPYVDIRIATAVTGDVTFSICSSAVAAPTDAQIAKLFSFALLSSPAAGTRLVARLPDTSQRYLSCWATLTGAVDGTAIALIVDEPAGWRAYDDAIVD